MDEFLKPELSKDNPYWIERHRYYELKHFCLQYESWKRALESVDYISIPTYDVEGTKYDIPKPVESITERRERCLNNIHVVEEAARMTDGLLCLYLLEHVTKGLTYDKLNARKKIPCNREDYYRLYRRFFWILNMLRG